LITSPVSGHAGGYQANFRSLENQDYTLRMKTRALSLAQVALVGVFLFFPMKLGAANTLLALTLVLTIISGNFQERWAAVRENPITVPALTMFALIVAGASYSSGPIDTILQSLNKYSKFLFLLLAISLLGEDKWRQRCWLAFSAAMVFTLASVYAGLWVHIPWAKEEVTTPSGWGTDHTIFKDYIAQGLLLSTFAAYAITRAIEAPGTHKKTMWAVLALLAIIAVLFLSNGRTGYLAVSCMLITYALAIVPKRLRLYALLVSTAFITVGLLSSPNAQTRIGEVFAEAQTQLSAPMGVNRLNGETSTGARLSMWAFSIEQIKERPLLGSGTGSYGSLVRSECDDQPNCDVISVHPHNQFLFFGVELGLIGLFSFCLYLYAAAKASAKLEPPRRALLLSFLAIFVVDSLVHGALWLAVENHLFTFILALLMAEISAAKNQPTLA
jgi:O-antigen ligase